MGRKNSKDARSCWKTDHVAPPPREKPPKALWLRDAAKPWGVVFSAYVRYFPSTRGMMAFSSSVWKAGKVEVKRSFPRSIFGMTTIVGSMRPSWIMWSTMCLNPVGLDCVPIQVRSDPAAPCMR